MAKSILVVDYDPKRIEATARSFQQAGYDVATARDGIAGVETFARSHPDLVLVEMMLPKRHGFEVCQELRKLRPGKRVPVLILGSTAAERYRLQAISAGANDYLVRPVEWDRLLGICRDLLSEPNQDLPASPVGETDSLEDSLPDFFPDPPAKPAPSRPAADDFLESFLNEVDSEAPAPPVELTDLSDDDIMARLDAILPTTPPPKPEPAPRPETSPRAETPPRVVQPPAPRPDRPVPRAKLPQTAPVLEAPSPEAPAARRGIPWLLAAGVALVTLVGGFYAYRALRSDTGDVSQAAALDAGDFARVLPSEPPPLPPTPVYESSSSTDESAPVEPIETAPAEAAPTPRGVPTPPSSGPVAAKPEPRAVAPAPAQERAAPPAPAPAPEPPKAPSRPPIAAESPVTSAPPQAAEPADPAPALLPSSLSSVGMGDLVPQKSVTPPQERDRVAPGSLVGLTEVDSVPVAVTRVAPVYPPAALRMRREGKVSVRLLVDENGSVADATVDDASAPRDFATSALDAARQWKYRPALKDGVPVKVWITEVIGFKR